MSAPQLAKLTISRRCPKCLSDRIHRSHRRDWVEKILASLGAVLRRCHACGTRQAWWGNITISLGADQSYKGRFTSVLVLCGGFVLCLGFLWWMITRFTGLSG